MAERTSSLVPSFSYSGAAGRYRNVNTGRYVPAQQVRAALDSVLAGSAGRMRGLSERLAGGDLSVRDWQRAMAGEIRIAHVAATASARGGWAQLSQADLGFSGQRIRTQYAYLGKMAEQIATGKQPLTGVAARAELYGHAARATARAMEGRIAREKGAAEERNVLGAADHCQSCLSEAARGWVEVGMLVPVGARTCLSRCHCWISYRTAPESELIAA